MRSSENHPGFRRAQVEVEEVEGRGRRAGELPAQHAMSLESINLCEIMDMNGVDTDGGGGRLGMPPA